MSDWDPEANDLFMRAIDLPSPGDRDRFLDGACGGRPDLRARVDGLLRAVDQAGSFLEHPAAEEVLTGPHVPAAPVEPATPSLDPASTASHRDPAAPRGPVTPASAVGTTVGPYKLLQEIGEGGMGTVYLAQQTAPVRRLVAVKLVKPGMDSKSVLARFEAERQALALMDHPNIAKVLDAGATPGGRPFFVMELVKGVPITRHCDEHRLGVPARLALFADVCRAVQHAHQKGVIHRDLKPSNVLVAPYDGRPVVKVIDFGVAKAAGQPLTEKTLVTGLGAVVGTPEYMSPEQAELNNLDIDTRSDVYALGVLLYELLTGTTPLTRKRAKEAALLELLRLVREEEPQRPSTRLSTTSELPTIAANRGVEPGRLSRLVRGELDWIVMKALEKDRNRRYESANAFAADVDRYLADEPVLACPPGAGYRVRRFVRRNRWPVLAAAVFVVLLAAGVVGTTTGLVRALAAEKRAVKDRDEKEDARRRARQALDLMTDEVIEDLLQRQAELTDQHRDFLRRVLADYEAFAAAGADDPESRRGRAGGLFRVGRIHFLLGEFKDGEAAYRDAAAQFDRVAAESAAEELARARRNQASCQLNLGVLLRDTGRTKEAETAFNDSLGLLRQLEGGPLGPGDVHDAVILCHVNLGILLSDNGREKEAEPHYRAALKLAKALAAAAPDRPLNREQVAFGCNNLGILLQDTGRTGEAEEAYREALAVRRKLVAEFPRRPLFRSGLALSCNNLAALLRRTGRLDEAEPLNTEALAVRKRLAAEYPNQPQYRADLVQGYLNLGNIHRDRGRPADAEAAYRDGVAGGTVLAADFPDRPEYRHTLARTHAALGNLIRRTRPAEGEVPLREALGILKGLAAKFPTRSDFRLDLGRVYQDLGVHCDLNHRPAEAGAGLRESLAVLTPLAAEFPGRPDFRSHLAKVHWSVGNLMLAATRPKEKRPKEAEAAYLDARAIQERLVAEFNDRSDFRADLLHTQTNLGVLLAGTGRPKEAEELWRATLAGWKKLVEAYPAAPEYQNGVAGSLVNIATLHADRKEFADAAKLLDEARPHHLAALKVKDTDPEYRQYYHINLTTAARCYRTRGDHARLAATVEELLRFGYKLPDDLYDAAANLSHCMTTARGDARLGEAKRRELADLYADHALAALRRAADLGYNDPSRFPGRPRYRHELANCYVQVGVALDDVGRAKEAEAAYLDALTIQARLAADSPDVPDYRCDLAGTLVNLAVLQRQRREFGAAAALLDEARPHHLAALKADPKNPKYSLYYRNNLSCTADCRLGTADHAGLATTAEELARHGYDLPDDLYRAVNFLCRCVDLAGKDPRLNEAARKERADGYADRAVALLQKAADLGYKDPARFPDRPKYRRGLAQCHTQVAFALLGLRRSREAEELLREVRAIQGRLAADFPGVPDYRNDLAGTLVNLAGEHMRRREFEAAVGLLEEARPHHLAALKADPKNFTYRRYYRNNLSSMAGFRVALADHARAAAAADELARFGFDPANDAYTAGSVLARCAALARNDARLDEDKREEFAEDYATRAVARLRQAVANGFRNPAQLRKDSWLDGVRDREDFRKLVAEVEEKAKK
jgi:serine/threonine protein kinase/tetratricopeptide (TPR) repeat protein